jgi:hypothetical protein
MCVLPSPRSRIRRAETALMEERRRPGSRRRKIAIGSWKSPRRGRLGGGVAVEPLPSVDRVGVELDDGPGRPARYERGRPRRVLGSPGLAGDVGRPPVFYSAARRADERSRRRSSRFCCCCRAPLRLLGQRGNGAVAGWTARGLDRIPRSRAADVTVSDRSGHRERPLPFRDTGSPAAGARPGARPGVLGRRDEATAAERGIEALPRAIVGFSRPR